MSRQPDYVKKKFAPLQQKTLKNALAHRIQKEFPRLGGPRIRALCAEMILDVVKAHLRPREHVRHGQVVWMAVSIDDPPSRGKRIADTDLIPVVLDLSGAGDVQSRLDRRCKRERIQHKAVRLCRQAYEQGGVLSNCDLAELLNQEESWISNVLTEAERESGQVIPRRATVHDVGTGLTHKRIICLKRFRDGKSPDDIARETCHSLEAVDRYLGQSNRVRHCRQQGMTVEETAFALNCSLSLVKEYLAIDRELENTAPD